MTKEYWLGKVTRVVVVTPDCEVEQWHSFNGVEIHVQDDGRTMKIFPGVVND